MTDADIAARCARWSPLEKLSIEVAATAADARLHRMPTLAGLLEVLSARLQSQALDVDEQVDDGLSAEDASIEGLAHACRPDAPPPAHTITTMRFAVVVVVSALSALSALGLTDLVSHVLS